MICVPGHGRGVDDIVGIDDRGQERTDRAGYQHDFAIQAAEAGIAAVAIEPAAFGCRRDPLAAARALDEFLLPFERRRPDVGLNRTKPGLNPMQFT